MKASLTAMALGILVAAVTQPRAVHVRTLRLPAAVYEYANVPLPAHFQDARAYDNTPPDNPITNDGATLGRVLFYDTALSGNGTTSCSSCHKQQHAFADPNPVSSGADGRLTDRHAMNLTGLRFYPRARFFWDERGDNLEDVVLLPVRTPIEMGGDSRRLPEKLAALPYYPELFHRAFGDPAITEPRIERALAQFVRSLISYRSRFDEGRARARSDEDDFDNFTRQENRGKALFRRTCATCHSEAEALPFVLLLPSNNGSELDPRSSDGGVADITLNALDAGRFKSPTLRNVEVAGPYMHNGSLATLEDVIDHYSRTFNRHPNLDFRMTPFNFTASERAALVAFLKTLTDRAFLTDPRFGDPFDPPGAPAAAVKAVAPAPPPQGPLPPRGDVDAVIARVMSFDANGDGRVAGIELSERMQGLVLRGDRNLDGALDREEIRAITSSSPVIGEGVGMAPRPRREVDITVASLRDPGLTGLIDDLKLPPDRRAPALAALALAEVDTVNAVAASLDTLRREMHPMLTHDDVTALDDAIRKHAKAVRMVLGAVTAQAAVRPTFSMPGADLDRAVHMLALKGDSRAGAEGAVDRHLERMHELGADRSKLLRRLALVLTSDELADFAAALERHGAKISRAERSPR